MDTLLFAPPGYWKLTPEQRFAVCNGCGTRSTWWVPDTLLGLSIKEACNIHNYMYETGETKEDKDVADRVFRNNALRLIKTGTRSRILMRVRARLAQLYFDVLQRFGGPAFWDGKNLPEEMGYAAAGGGL